MIAALTYSPTGQVSQHLHSHFVFLSHSDILALPHSHPTVLRSCGRDSGRFDRQTAFVALWCSPRRPQWRHLPRRMPTIACAPRHVHSVIPCSGPAVAVSAGLRRAACFPLLQSCISRQRDSIVPSCCSFPIPFPLSCSAPTKKAEQQQTQSVPVCSCPGRPVTRHRHCISPPCWLAGLLLHALLCARAVPALYRPDPEFRQPEKPFSPG